MALMHGAGGYGGITTLNQDSRQGKYYPHTNIFVYKQHPVSTIKCLTCYATWESNEDYPKICKKDDWKSAEEILSGK